MAKSTVSAGFAKKAAKTTKGDFDKARKGERFGRGIPFPVGTIGTGYVSALICDQTKPEPDGIKHSRVRVELCVETPESGRGKTLSGIGLMQIIKDGRDPEKWSEAMAWGAMLGMLEDLGCPEEITQNYDDFQEVIDWFDNEKRFVNWEITDASYTNYQGKEVVRKGVAAFAAVSGSSPTAGEGESPEEDPNADYCKYRGTRHKILEDKGDTYDLQSMANGRKKIDIDKDEVEME